MWSPFWKQLLWRVVEEFVEEFVHILDPRNNKA